MIDCFISYSSKDQTFADVVYRELVRSNVSAFMAPVSIEPGQNWASEILNNLRNSKWVIVLASDAACESPFVNQEIGGAVLSRKQVIPIVWDMSPALLPGWASALQAIDLRDRMNDLNHQIGLIAQRIKDDKVIQFGIIVILILMLVLVVFFLKS